MRSFMLCGVHKLKESRKAENRGQRDAAPQKPKKPRYQEDMETRKPGNHAGGNEETRKPGNQETMQAGTRKPGNQETREPEKQAARPQRTPGNQGKRQTGKQAHRQRGLRGKEANVGQIRECARSKTIEFLRVLN